MKNEWLSLQDHIPPLNKKVLFIDADLDIRIGILRNIEKDDTSIHFSVNALTCITHWMPLPELPSL